MNPNKVNHKYHKSYECSLPTPLEKEDCLILFVPHTKKALRGLGEWAFLAASGELDHLADDILCEHGIFRGYLTPELATKYLSSPDHVSQEDAVKFMDMRGTIGYSKEVIDPYSDSIAIADLICSVRESMESLATMSETDEEIRAFEISSIFFPILKSKIFQGKFERYMIDHFLSFEKEEGVLADGAYCIYYAISEA